MSRLLKRHLNHKTMKLNITSVCNCGDLVMWKAGGEAGQTTKQFVTREREVQYYNQTSYPWDITLWSHSIKKIKTIIQCQFIYFSVIQCLISLNFVSLSRFGKFMWPPRSWGNLIILLWNVGIQAKEQKHARVCGIGINRNK